MRVEIICINYFSANYVEDFARSIQKQASSADIHLVVVENSANVTELKKIEKVASQFSNITLINSGKNLGYFGAAQYALEHIEKSPQQSDWIIISNADIQINQAEFFTHLSKLNSDFHVVGPAIRSTRTRENQNPYMVTRPEKLKMHFHKWVSRYVPVSYAYQGLSAVKQSLQKFGLSHTSFGESNRREMYASHGSFMIFSKNYFKAGGNFQYGSFLFGEEIFVAETCRRLGLKTMYVPELEVEHHEHVSTGLFPSKKSLQFISQSSRFVADTYFR